MLVKIIVLLLTVWQVLADTSFIENGTRTKLFELIDNEIPTFRVTIPDNMLTELKEACQVPFTAHDDSIDRIIKTLKGEKVEPREEPKVKTKEATLVVEINGEKKSFDKVTFSLGGNSSRLMARQGYNIKIRGKKDLYGLTQFKLRSDAHDATYLRTKLVSDIHNRLGLTSISASYVILYINDEYYGLHMIIESLKLPWIKGKFDDEDTPYLYNCSKGACFLNPNCMYTCENENEDVTDNSEFSEFLKKVETANSAKDIEDIFEIDQFLYEMAYEYLLGAWDHIFIGHNFVLYKQKNGKWNIIYYDYDNDFGQDPVDVEYGLVETNPNKDYANYTFDEWFNRPIRVVDILLYKNQDRFKKIMNDFVTRAFNPDVLFPRIDELKELIRPHVKYDKTPDENGICPGVINFVNPIEYSYEQFEANSEFTTIEKKELRGSAYGIKYWILARYRRTCETFNLDCNPVYLDENYEYPIVKEMEGEIDTHKFDGIDFTVFQGGNPFYHRDSNDTYSYTIDSSKPSQTPISEEPTSTQISNAEPTSTQDSKYKCLSELVGYPCCAKGIKAVYAKDEYGEWGYDFKKNEWCGLTPYEERTKEETCWSEKYGYPCCNGCYVFETDDDGQWGYENNQWCGIQSYCSN
ncbi:hypothetical protein BCR32DRAFT_232114 [Anaeromyces robustus]|uniref:CBM10 domain-containing protein n=1 Tax=Anaeromyces robustus TaxID=1754192 RepID=A0A1Y1XA42_9FUNG|nr:hypothetical protein BCR32DRAFT_232114 [Anaeromyces robustus]|eukprot:ORX82214.1 hypothetical protein BCR32DRAFT_232114 [Anaeromyces robustus]